MAQCQICSTNCSGAPSLAWYPLFILLHLVNHSYNRSFRPVLEWCSGEFELTSFNAPFRTYFPVPSFPVSDTPVLPEQRKLTINEPVFRPCPVITPGGHRTSPVRFETRLYLRVIEITVRICILIGLEFRTGIFTRSYDDCVSIDSFRHIKSIFDFIIENKCAHWMNEFVLLWYRHIIKPRFRTDVNFHVIVVRIYNSHTSFEDIHNSHRQPSGWRCESEARVPSSRELVTQYNQELCISSNSRCFTYRLQPRQLNWSYTSFSPFISV